MSSSPDVRVALQPAPLPAHLLGPLLGGGVALLLQPCVAPHLDLLPVLNLLRGLTQSLRVRVRQHHRSITSSFAETCPKMVNKKLEFVKLNIDLIALDIENLPYSEKLQAIEALKNIEIKTVLQSTGQGAEESISYYSTERTKAIHCVTCGKEFSNNYNLKRHQQHKLSCEQYLRRQNMEHNVQCSVCDFKTNSKANLRAHSVRHTEKNMCHHCNRKYTTRRDLIKHQQQTAKCR